LLAAVTMLAVVGIVFGEEAARFEIYSLGFSDPEAALLAAKAIVGESGTVTLERAGNRLLVLATSAEHKKLAEVLARLNVRPRNVQIEVQFRGRATAREAEASLGGSGEVVQEKGVLRTTIRIQPRLLNSTTTSSHDVRQILLVASGREGYLRVGEQVPYLEWLVDYGLHWGVYRERVQWQEVGAFLIVRPEIVGDGPLIRVQLTPELRGLVNGSPYHTRFAGVTTEVVVQSGQTFPLGGLDQHQAFYQRFLVGGRSEDTVEKLDILLTPRIIELVQP
jgi:hypothetical protein